MKILIAGDTHGNLEHWRYLINTAHDLRISTVVQVGDFGYWEHMPEGVKFLDRLNAYASPRGIQIHFLDGNHDKTSLLIDRYDPPQYLNPNGSLRIRTNINYLPRGLRWTWGDTRFIALGGAYSVDKAYRLRLERDQRAPERYWFPEEEMTDEDMATILLDTEGVEVILAHDKPRASNPMWNRKAFAECLPNQDRLQLAVNTLKPKLFVHGHLHYRYTDTIRSGDDTWTKVEGLHCDPEGTMHWPYDPTESWLLFDSEEEGDEQDG